MAKVSLTQAELAALDALIAELKGDNKIVEAEIGSAAFITAIAKAAVQVAKVAVKATPVVADVAEVATAVIGAKAANDEVHKSLSAHVKEGLPLDKLIELRKKFN
jgi:transcription elongation factor